MKPALSKERVGFYLIAGLIYFAMWELFNITNENSASLFTRTMNELWRTIYIIAVNYLLFEYTIPGLSRKKIFKSVLLLLFQFFLFSFGLYFWRYVGIPFKIYTEIRVFPSVEAGVDYYFPYSVGSVAVFAIARHVYGHIKLRRAAQQLRMEKQLAELNYLKSQTNPHFLFNTLNNIYSLARDKSDLAPESILRLSKILRFMLYETGGDYIPIETELKIISDYIALEKLRYDETLRVSFNQEITDKAVQVPPLLLIPLVENAFKHGASETGSEPFVDIFLRADGKQLIFIVKNSAEKPAEETVKENIGLSNLRRQLELLYTEYELTVKQDEQVFTASLKINLTSHVKN